MRELTDDALKALEAVDFEWAVHLKSVWTDIDYDIPSIHGVERDSILSRIQALKESPDPRSPLGLVIRGNAGAGKTHMLSALRRNVLSSREIFILVDMTDVREFWETVNLSYLSSLDQGTPVGGTQLEHVLRGAIAHAELPLSFEQIIDCAHPSWNEHLRSLLSGLARKDRAATRKHADLIRAASLLGSDDFDASNTAYNWLLGIQLEDNDFRRIGLTRPCCTPMEAVEGLSWMIGLKHCTVLALDQLDSIVSQHSLVSSVEQHDSDEQKLSQAIIEGIAGGVSALRDKTSRTLTIVTCIEKTWDSLSTQALSSFRDRFESSPILLTNVYDAASTAGMVANRLSNAYRKFNIEPAYSTWPYSPKFFHDAEGMLPRELLKECDRHRQQCLKQGSITELTTIGLSTSPSPFSHQLDEAYERLVHSCIPPDLTKEREEDGQIATLIQFAAVALARELDVKKEIKHDVDTLFTGGWSAPRPIHARIRQILHIKGDDERHLSLRVLMTANARAYCNRIKLAIGASGIDRSLKRRHLLIFRNSEPPTGPKSQQLTQQFLSAGGEFVPISAEDLQRLEALRQLCEQNGGEFDAWAQQRRPLNQLELLRPVVAWLREHGSAARGAVSQGSGSLAVPHPVVAGWQLPPPPQPPPTWTPPWKPTSEPDDFDTPPTPAADQPPIPPLGERPEEISGCIPVGFRWSGQKMGAAVFLTPEQLSRHTVVLAGSGSGKTVLIRRLVEEAALQGIPSIVIDGANDLARLGDRWDKLPDHWHEAERRKAETYHHRSEVILWTPGLESGNPLQLNPLPDFTAIDDHEERDQATDMARDALQDIVAPGTSQSAQLKRGILKAALNHFAEVGRSADLDDFITLLRELPPDACEGISNAGKKAQEMADALWAEVQNNPLLRQPGHSLDPATLLGTGASGEHTRISVINLTGLQGLSAQRQFLNQLFMTMFTWIKKNPPPPETPLRGLLVLDEAKDFVPSREAAACKASFNRLVAQARKYGLGIVVATQVPKSIDHNVIANCSTQLFGRANSPTAIMTVSDLISLKGGNPADVSSLKSGQFYISSEGISPPAKILTPLCLSYHPPSPLGEEEVIQRASSSREALQQKSLIR